MKQGEQWVIFYGDGSEFSSADGSPWDAPRQDVQIIASSHPMNGYNLVHGQDYFYYEEDRGGFAGCDQFSLYDHLIRAKYPCPLFGRMMSDIDWKSFFSRAKAKLGPKTGWTSEELRNGLQKST